MKYEKIIEQNKDFINEVFEKLDKKLERNAVKYRYTFPHLCECGEYDDMRKVDPTWWTNGFFGGLMWLMYKETEKEEYLKSALEAEKMLDEAFANVDKLHHDVGFMWHITSGLSYKITKNADSRNRALLASMILASRYNVDGDYIRAWNYDMKGFSIIDTMLNLPLLYFASREIGDERFTRIAKRHADMVARDHVREDGSLCHIVNHNTETPGVIETLSGQGYAVGSSWSRGVSWAVYGFILAYIHTGKDLYLEVAKKTATHFIEETRKTSWLPRLDFCQPSEPMYYDSSAGAVAICGLIEIARALPEEEGSYYMDSALNILHAMEEEWCDYSDKKDGILTMASEAYTEGRKKHLPIIYGDFFFTEAIIKLKDPDFLVW